MASTAARPGRFHSRRHVLQVSLAATAGLVFAPRIGRAKAEERRLGLVNLHTGERVEALYWANGALVDEELRRVDRLMRDHRNGKVTEIDPRLIDKLWHLGQAVGARQSFQLISGYRSPESNARLAASTEGVAEDSFHVRGQAADVRLPGVDLLDLRRAARAQHSGGVGYYPFSDFLHLDTGPTRFW